MHAVLAFRNWLSAAVDGMLYVGLLILYGSFGLLPSRPMTAFAGWLMRTIGPHLAEHQIGCDNLRHAFPDKDDTARAAILSEAWTNLGRVGAEFLYLARWGSAYSENVAAINIDERTAAQFRELHDKKTGALVFAAHLGNWELPAIAAHAAGLQTVLLFRRPSVRAVARLIQAIRTSSMGELVASGLSAPVVLARAAAQGKYVGMLVDQHERKGVPVAFFGRMCFANPLIALLARQCAAPIHGVRSVRLKNGQYSLEMTPPIDPVRD